MRVMVMIKSDANTEAGVMPNEQDFLAMGRYNEELVKAGIMLGGEGLHPSTQGARVFFSGDKQRVVDGPFAEAKELIAGYWIWQVKSMEEAIEWVKRCPNPSGQETAFEIRRVYDMEDFGEVVTPEVQAQDQRLRNQIEANSQS